MKNSLTLGKADSDVQKYIDENKEKPEQLANDEEIKRTLLAQIEYPKILLMGMPDRQPNHFIGNIAQYPQGPKVKDFSWLPETAREWINDQLKNVFNPNIATPYVGINLIKQNLEQDLPKNYSVELKDHPKTDEIMERLEQEYYSVIGLAVGGENIIPDAEKFVRDIQEQYLSWVERMKTLIKKEGWNLPAIKVYIQELRMKFPIQLLETETLLFGSPRDFAISELDRRFGKKLAEQIMQTPDILDYLMPVIVTGNYGATTAKRIYLSKEGEGREKVLDTPGKYKTKILWDSKKDRKKIAAKGKYPYIGEGIHDMRAFLMQEMGIPLKHGPDDEKLGRGVKELSLDSENPVMAYLNKKLGLSMVCNEKFYYPGSIGCTNTCDFCCTAAQFEGNRMSLYKNPEELADSMIAQFRESKANQPKEDSEIITTDDGMFWIQDENLTKTPGAIDSISSKIKESGENLHWGISSDIAGLREYKEKNGSFIELARGGLSIIWLGIESKSDFYNKRKGATTEEVESIVKELQSLGIMIIGSFQIGIPIHTEEATKKNKKGEYKSLNIHEDIDWCIGLNTAAHQFNVFTYFNATKDKKHLYKIKTKQPDQEYNEASLELLGAPDDAIAHLAVSNVSQIPSNDRLEELDKMARQKIYNENGPVSIRALLTLWDGFMKLKDSTDPADILQATYRYWTVKNVTHLMSLSTPIFSEMVFDPVSDKFMKRLARCLLETGLYAPKENPLNDNYKQAYKKYSSEINPIVKIIGEGLRMNLIDEHLNNNGTHQPLDLQVAL
jgi:hypothetical protein